MQRWTAHHQMPDHSPLPGQSLLLSPPPPSDMLKFSGLLPVTQVKCAAPHRTRRPLTLGVPIPPRLSTTHHCRARQQAVESARDGVWPPLIEPPHCGLPLRGSSLHLIPLRLRNFPPHKGGRSSRSGGPRSCPRALSPPLSQRGKQPTEQRRPSRQPTGAECICTPAPLWEPCSHRRM